MKKFCTEFQAVYDLWNIKPEPKYAEKLNTMIETLIDNDIWKKLDVFYNFSNNEEIPINWKNPTTFKYPKNEDEFRKNLLSL